MRSAWLPASPLSVRGRPTTSRGDVLLPRERREHVELEAAAVALDAVQRHGEAALGVGDGDADATVAYVEAEEAA